MNWDHQQSPQLIRSFSLPNAHTAEYATEPNQKRSPRARRKSHSLTRVDDQSNSAAPVRRQPHPLAMQALGFRPMFGGRGNRLPEWPPPDPPPLTPLPLGISRTVIAPPNETTATPIWPPRPWWRRQNPSRLLNPIIHVALETADTAIPPPSQLTERPARIGWTSTSDEAEVDQELIATTDTTTPIPQMAEISEVEGNLARGEPSTSVISTEAHPVSVAHISARAHSADGSRIRNTQSAGQTEEVELVSLNSEEVQEESTFHIFIVVDTNPDRHIGAVHGELAQPFQSLLFMEHILRPSSIARLLTEGESGVDLQSMDESSSD
ncbi:hypothetical protein D915_001191 [Fasciola hepatica]|uniref:Uncharacterized protein n=1 Tax=Fasciola hepatica TaxID=6192 RepID=A0A4E0RKR2_FASHE|nr:hypothetical protein D915_001191 [Fasciola hepatica]